MPHARASAKTTDSDLVEVTREFMIICRSGSRWSVAPFSGDRDARTLQFAYGASSSGSMQGE